MKRSEINAAVKLALDTLEEYRFYLPPMAHWTLADWKKADLDRDRVIVNGLGWEITDFGSGNLSPDNSIARTLVIRSMNPSN